MAGSAPPRIAVYSPAKALADPSWSGEQTILRNSLAALRLAGFAPEIACGLRLLDMQGDAARQAEIRRAAMAEADRLVAALAADRPALWYTYHTYYKCPDLVGPPVARALHVPYVVQQPTLSPRREAGPWAGFARAAREAVMAADLLFWTTRRDLPALRAAGLGERLVELPPAIEPGPPPAHGGAHAPLRLLSVAMMRPGDKLESYRRLAAALAHLAVDWRLGVVGDGPAEAEVRALFARFGARVTFRGRIDDPATLRAAYEEADLFLWPGVGEGVGMVYLEAQAAGLPVVAEDNLSQRDVVEGPLVAPGDAPAFAAAIAAAAADRAARSAAARARIEARHTPGAAAEILRRALGGLIR